MLTRRGLLGMFAAGAAAAVLPSGVIMPVRRIWMPNPWLIVEGDSITWVGGIYTSAMEVYRNDLPVHLNAAGEARLEEYVRLLRKSGARVAVEPREPAVGAIPRPCGKTLARSG